MAYRPTLKSRLAIQEQKEQSWARATPKPESAEKKQMKKKGCVVCGGGFHRICLDPDGKRHPACNRHWRQVHNPPAEENA